MIKVNGCDFWPDGTWKHCCDAHDVAFFSVGELRDFVVANTEMISCVAQASNVLNALFMGVGVFVGGAFVWKWKALGGRSIFELITRKPY